MRSTRRLSLVYFSNCNPDAQIECLARCRDAANPPRHPSITAGEHHRMELVKSARGAPAKAEPESA